MYVDIYVNSEGIIRTVNDDLLIQIITDYRIPAGKIGMCRECNRFFWAKRSDQNCCGKKCTNAYHVRVFRRKKKQQDEQRARELYLQEVGQAVDEHLKGQQEARR